MGLCELVQRPAPVPSQWRPAHYVAVPRIGFASDDLVIACNPKTRPMEPQLRLLPGCSGCPKRLIAIALVPGRRRKAEALQVFIGLAGFHHRLNRLGVDAAGLIHAPLSGCNLVSQVDGQEVRLFLVTARRNLSLGAFQDDAAVVPDQFVRVLGIDAGSFKRLPPGRGARVRRTGRRE